MGVAQLAALAASPGRLRTALQSDDPHPPTHPTPQAEHLLALPATRDGPLHPEVSDAVRAACAGAAVSFLEVGGRPALAAMRDVTILLGAAGLLRRAPPPAMEAEAVMRGAAAAAAGGAAAFQPDLFRGLSAAGEQARAAGDGGLEKAT